MLAWASATAVGGPERQNTLTRLGGLPEFQVDMRRRLILMSYALTYMTKDLKSAYVLWSNEPFPPGSTRDDIGELHADLALVDEWVMSMSSPTSSTAPLSP
jgi:hypothetical protein